MANKKIKIMIVNGKIILPLYIARGGIRIADESGNHITSPTKSENNPNHFVEWMITNEEIKLISKSFLEEEDVSELIEELQKIKDFVEETKYSKRETVKVIGEKLENLLGFEIYKYTENFYSFEKTLPSEIKVRITFKLGDVSPEPEPHMYVLLPFNHQSIKIKNNSGDVRNGEILGSKCFAESILEKNDIAEIIKTLAHSSKNHRDALIGILKS